MTKEQMAEIRTYRVYALIFPDNSQYIGVTSAEKLYDRFKYGSGYKNEPVYEAIMEWAWHNVKQEVLQTIEGNWYEAHAAEVDHIKAAVVSGIKLWNRDHNRPEKEKKYNLDGVTLTDINRYFETYKAAADFIGVTRQAIRCALAENRPCKGWSLAYGDVTNDEENDEKTEA